MASSSSQSQSDDRLALIMEVFKEEKETLPKTKLYNVLCNIEEETKENTNRLTMVISGGQIGADQEGLEAAFKLGIPTGGWAPRMYVTSRGPMPRLKTMYHLKEIEEPVPLGYIIRSKKNVDESDGTVAFLSYRSDCVGTNKTIGYCRTKKWQILKTYSASKPYKPVLVLSIEMIDRMDPFKFDKYVNDFREFIIDNNIKTLNVCGTRSTGGDMPVYNFLFTALAPFI
jgi:hypothetical protein